MLIDLNGMQYHLHIQRPDAGSGFKAEIVDEAFNFDVHRELVDDLDGVAALVTRYSGIAPRTEVLSQIAGRLEDLYRTERLTTPVARVLASDAPIASAG